MYEDDILSDYKVIKNKKSMVNYIQSNNITNSFGQVLFELLSAKIFKNLWLINLKIDNMDDLLSLAQEVVNLRRHAFKMEPKHTIKLKQYLKFSITKIKSGTKCWDWQIPKNGVS